MTPEMVSRAYHQNDHGGGVAWREKGYVKWKKGLDEKGMQEMVKDLPLPFITHFRIASCGGKSPQLCHPFPISADVDLALEGQTKGFVLFHNGHWNEWKHFTKETALRKGTKIPMGSWSDSRAMAWAANHYGLGILEMIDEKCVAFGPGELELVRGTGWDDVEGVWCSNKHWNYGTHHRTNYSQHQGGRGFLDKTHDDKDDYFRRADLMAEAKRKADEIAKKQSGESKIEVPGGDFTRLPFDLVDKIWKDQQGKPRSEWKLSKKQWKRAKKAHEKKEGTTMGPHLVDLRFQTLH